LIKDIRHSKLSTSIYNMVKSIIHPDKITYKEDKTI